MPTAIFPLDYLKRLTTATPQQLEQQAFDYGLEATLSENALVVDVTAERPDLLAPEGFARAINIYNGATREVPDQLAKSGMTVTVSPAMQDLRPFIAALVVENVEIGTSGVEMLVQFQEKITQTFGRQRKKTAIGIYNLNQIQGNVHYTTAPKSLKFQPLQSDRPMSIQEILTNHPSGKLYAHTLPESDFVPILQDDAGTILAMPPIINAAGVGAIAPDSTRLFIDVTGTTRQSVIEVVNILAHNFLDVGATVKTVCIQYPDHAVTRPSLTPKSVFFSAKFLNEIVGTSIPKADLNLYLQRMDLQATGTSAVLVPSYRTDILSEIDIAGDLLVAVGIENLQADQSTLKFYTGQSDPLKNFAHQVGDWAQRMGLMEVKSFILTDPELLSLFSDRYVQTGNARSRTHSTTRVTLQAGLLDILSQNINAPKPINIYEIGEILVLNPDGIVSETSCWSFASLETKASFAIAKSYTQTLLKALGLEYSLIECDDPRYISGRAATVQIQGESVGHFGEIHPHILSYFSFPEPICSGELDCQLLMNYVL